MDDLKNFKIKKLGILKFNRIKAISILRKTLFNFGYDFSIPEVKSLFDSILNNELIEEFNRKYKFCFDQIFEGTEYEELGYTEFDNEQNFPTNYIPPRAI